MVQEGLSAGETACTSSAVERGPLVLSHSYRVVLAVQSFACVFPEEHGFYEGSEICSAGDMERTEVSVDLGKLEQVASTDVFQSPLCVALFNGSDHSITSQPSQERRQRSEQGLESHLLSLDLTW